MTEQKFELTMQATERGFNRIDFVDRYGESCSLQMSSLATEAAIWFGCDRGRHVEGACMARMHLTQEMVRQLLLHLQRFVETGELGEIVARGATAKRTRLPYGGLTVVEEGGVYYMEEETKTQDVDGQVRVRVRAWVISEELAKRHVAEASGGAP